MLNKFLFVYLDDIICCENKHVCLVLRRLLEKTLFVKAENCEFHASTVSFLGFIIYQGQLSANPVKVLAVVEWPTPSTRKQLERFLGFAPLAKLTSTLGPFAWTEEAEAAFMCLKVLFTTTHVLFAPRSSLSVYRRGKPFSWVALTSS